MTGSQLTVCSSMTSLPASQDVHGSIRQSLCVLLSCPYSWLVISFVFFEVPSCEQAQQIPCLKGMRD